MRQEKFEASAALYEKFQKKHPDSPYLADVCYGEAVCLFHMEKFTTSLSRFGSLLNKYKDRTDLKEGAQFYVAESWFQRGSYLEAENEYRKFLSQNPNSTYVPLVQYRLGESLLARRENGAGPHGTAESIWP